jgi:hypothetical protein
VHAGTKRAAGTNYYYNPYSDNIYTNVGYEMLSDATKGTITIYVSNSQDPGYTPITNITTQCSATFQLRAGYAFDLKPPPGVRTQIPISASECPLRMLGQLTSLSCCTDRS